MANQAQIDAGRARARAIWALLTADPTLSLRDLAEQLGCAHTTVGYAVEKLERAGYVKCVGGRAWHIEVPFYDLSSSQNDHNDRFAEAHPYGSN